MQDISYFVKDIFILSTCATKGDGTVVYLPNPWLASQVISNFRRSLNMWDCVSIVVPYDIDDSVIQAMSEKMDHFFRTNTVDYTGPNGIDYAEIHDNHRMDINFWFEGRGNWQNTGLKGSRKIKAYNKMREVAKELNIKYTNMTSHVLNYTKPEHLGTEY